MEDVVIVGAGPIGLRLASLLAKDGFEVLVLEEHPEIGNPSHCSGLFSTHIFEIVGMEGNRGILHGSGRAKIVSPSSKVLEIGDGRTRAYVVDRVEFDRSIARDAINSGVDIHLKERVRRVHYPEVTTSSKSYRSRIIVGADGINSVVRKSMGVQSPIIIGAAQVVAKYDYESEDTVEIFLGSHVAPGFFAWAIPLFDGMAKVGLASYGHSWPLLKNLLRRIDAKPLSISGGGIPIGTVSRTYGYGTILVGDAAGQVKATSGGGVYPGLRAVECAHLAVRESLETGNQSEEFMKGYESCWRGTIGRELANALYIHSFYRKIRDDEFDRIVDELNREDMKRIINEYGDIDFPSRVVWKLLRRNPRLLKYVRIAMRRT